MLTIDQLEHTRDLLAQADSLVKEARQIFIGGHHLVCARAASATADLIDQQIRVLDYMADRGRARIRYLALSTDRRRISA